MNLEDNELHKELKDKIIVAAYKSVNELIKVLQSEIIPDENPHSLADFRYLQDASDDDILKMLTTFAKEEAVAADKMRNAVIAKKTALDDAFYILNKIETEKNLMDETLQEEEKNGAKFRSFAEGRSK